MFSAQSYTLPVQVALLDYLLRMADTSLVLGHRLSEWCGHGPVLEQDIALSNIALDLIGQARSWYQLAAATEDKGRDEDDLAYLRDALDYRNLLLAEQPNGDFGHTVMRQFLFDAYHYHLLKKMARSADENMAAIAEKSLKEVTYHLKWSSEWVIRLGDGTEESRRRIQHALDILWPFSGELTAPNATDKTLEAEGLTPDLDTIRPLWQRQVEEVLTEATLTRPDAGVWMQKGGKDGVHTEHLGFLLAEMQFLQRAYPNNKW
jgi:ring-1,2-phenylacetyl-CoA epoxidase subunit PaaC